MTDEIYDANDPRALMANNGLGQPVDGTEAQMGEVGPTGWFPPSLPSVVAVIDDGGLGPETDVETPVVLPVVEVPPVFVDVDPEVSYVAYAKDDPQQVIAIHGRMHRSALVAYHDTHEVLEVSAGDEVAIIGSGSWKVLDGQIVPAVIEPILEEVRQRAILRVDNDAERERLAYVTPGSAQALVYQAKKEESERFLALYPDWRSSQAANENEWPLLQAELGVTADTIYIVAETIKYLSILWITKASLIEKVRLSTKDKINLAATVAEIREILTVMQWPDRSQ